MKLLDIIFNPWLDAALSFIVVLFGLYILFFKRKEPVESSVGLEETVSVADELGRISEEISKQRQQMDDLQSMLKEEMRSQGAPATVEQVREEVAQQRQQIDRLQSMLKKVMESQATSVSVVRQIRAEVAQQRQQIGHLQSMIEGLKVIRIMLPRKRSLW